MPIDLITDSLRRVVLYEFINEKEQLQPLSSQVEKVDQIAIVLFPSREADPINSFYSEANLELLRNLQAAGITPVVTAIEQPSDIKTAIKKAKKLYPEVKIHSLYIEGHGEKDSILLSRKAHFPFNLPLLRRCKRPVEIALTKQSLKKDFFDLLDKDTEIILDSCLTGLEDGLAQAVCKIAQGRRVICTDKISFGVILCSPNRYEVFSREDKALQQSKPVIYSSFERALESHYLLEDWKKYQQLRQGAKISKDELNMLHSNFYFFLYALLPTEGYRLIDLYALHEIIKFLESLKQEAA